MPTDDGTRHLKLPLPDGRLAHQLRLTELRTELQRLKINGIGGRDSKDELLDLYSAHLVKIAGELRQPGEKFTYPLPLPQLDRAVEHLKQQVWAHES
jgi:hypothetical protein